MINDFDVGSTGGRPMGMRRSPAVGLAYQHMP